MHQFSLRSHFLFLFLFLLSSLLLALRHSTPSALYDRIFNGYSSEAIDRGRKKERQMSNACFRMNGRVCSIKSICAHVRHFNVKNSSRNGWNRTTWAKWWMKMLYAWKCLRMCVPHAKFVNSCSFFLPNSVALDFQIT